jgi:hypothetical protein
MDSNRRAALNAGVLFIVATVAYVAGPALSSTFLNDGHYLTTAAASASRVTIGALLEFIAAGASVGIAVAMYPVLKNWSAGLALGAVVFRTIEGVMLTIGAVSLLSLLGLSQQFARLASFDRGSFQAVADSMLGVRQQAVLASVFAFCVGALIYYFLFYKSRLVPRWLSGWGMAGIILMLAACLLALFSQHSVTTYTILILPIGVQEMVLAVWLIAKGFNSDTHQYDRPRIPLSA